jgi:Iap family predicted aminopeptidase
VIAAAETDPAGSASKKLAHRTDKLRFAVDAGAAGMIFVNQNPGLLHITGGIASPGGGPAAIIAVGTSWEHGQTILRLARRGGGVARVRISVGGSFNPDNVSFNVVGEIPGARFPDELVLAGGHYDGHDISQAALDDGAGAMVALEAARVLAALPPEAIGRTIRFVLFCGEEVGLFGSWAYTADHAGEVANTRFMLNLDGAGQGKGGAEALVISGRPELLPYFEELAAQTHYTLKITDELHSHSDHFPYAIQGIPTASLHSPDDSATMVGRGWGHTEADTFDKATLRGLQMGAMAAARLLLLVAADDAFPGERKTREDLQEQLTDLELDIALKRSGRWDLVGGPA